MQLTSEYAMEIVKRLESIQPYEVVFVNANGIVIAASEESRIGTYHAPAAARMENPQSADDIMIWDPGTSKQGRGCCIRVHDEIVGVIGLSGASNAVRPFLDAAKAIVELMLERELLSKELNLQETTMKSLLLSMLKKTPPNEEEIRRSLEFHHIDITIPRTTVLVALSALEPKHDQANNPLHLQETVSSFFTRLPSFFSRQGDMILCNELRRNAVILCVNRSKKPGSSDNLRSICRSVIDTAHTFSLRCQVVIGPVCSKLEDYFGKYGELEDLLQASTILEPGQDIYYGKSLILGNLLASLEEQKGTSFADQVLHQLLIGGKREIYLETLEALFRCNMNVNDTAARLHIHRSTLQYRMRRIQEMTGFSLYQLDDLIALRFAVLYLRNQDQHAI